MACHPDRHWAWTKPETIGRATALLTRKTRGTTSEADRTTPTISAPDPYSPNQTKAHPRETCSLTVFRAHLPAQTHLSTPHHQHLQDHRLPVQVRRQPVSHHPLRTLLVLPIMAQLAVGLSDLPLVTALNSDDLEAQALPSDLNLAPADLTTSSAEVVHRFWDLQDLLFTVKAIRWVAPVTWWAGHSRSKDSIQGETQWISLIEQTWSFLNRQRFHISSGLNVGRRHSYFGQPDYRIYELNKRLQQRTDVSCKWISRKDLFTTLSACRKVIIVGGTHLRTNSLRMMHNWH